MLAFDHEAGLAPVQDCTATCRFASELSAGLHVGVQDLAPRQALPLPMHHDAGLQLWLILEGSACLQGGSQDPPKACPPGSSLLLHGEHRPAQQVALIAEQQLRLFHLSYGAQRLPRLIHDDLDSYFVTAAGLAAAPSTSCGLTSLHSSPGILSLASKMSRSLPARRACDFLMLEANALEILSLTMRGLELLTLPVSFLPPQLSRRDLRRLRQAHDVLLQRVDHPWTLREVARLAGVNENKLKIGFRFLFGSSVYAYLQQQRMEAAARLLAGGEESIIQVALAVGYSSPSHFSKLFRRYFGVAPSQFIQTARAG